MGDWFANQMWNTSLPFLVTFFVIVMGFYYQTKSTLSVHGEKLTKLEQTIDDSKKENIADREKVRDAFLANSKDTAAGIAKLNETTAVMGATLLVVQKEIEKISQKLEMPPRK